MYLNVLKYSQHNCIIDFLYRVSIIQMHLCFIYFLLALFSFFSSCYQW